MPRVVVLFDPQRAATMPFWLASLIAINEREDLRQAREEIHRFWMCNQPSVLHYERLNGAIGP